MKYWELKEDRDILNLFTDKEVASLVKCTPGYVRHLRNGIRVASWDFYQKLSKRIYGDK